MTGRLKLTLGGLGSFTIGGSILVITGNNWNLFRQLELGSSGGGINQLSN